MANLNQQQLKKEIRGKNFAKVYFFFGEETFLIDSYTKSIENAIVSPISSQFDYKNFDYKNSSLDEVFSACEAFPMFSEKKCVVLNNFDAEKVKSSEMSKMEQLLNNPVDSCVLIIKNTSVEVNAKRSAKWKKFINLVDQVGVWSEFSYRDINSLASYLIDYAMKNKCSIDNANARLLIATSGSDIATLNNEMEKLCAFTIGISENDKNIITKETIEKVATQTAETTVFKLTDCLVAGQFDKAYSLLDLLFYSKEEPTIIVYNIANCYIDLYRAKASLESGVSMTQMVSSFEYKGMSWKFERALRDCKRVTLSQLRQSLEYIEQTEIKLKSTQINSRVLVEQLVAKLLYLYAKN